MMNGNAIPANNPYMNPNFAGIPSPQPNSQQFGDYHNQNQVSPWQQHQPSKLPTVAKSNTRFVGTNGNPPQYYPASPVQSSMPITPMNVRIVCICVILIVSYIT